LKKRAKPVHWLWALILILCAVRAFPQPDTQKRRIVVVISLDGFPAYTLDDPRLPIPTLRRLAKEGVIASSMQPVNPTYTWPNHTSLVTGVDACRMRICGGGETGSWKARPESWKAKRSQCAICASSECLGWFFRVRCPFPESCIPTIAVS
jgi:hypothetical protein